MIDAADTVRRHVRHNCLILHIAKLPLLLLPHSMGCSRSIRLLRLAVDIFAVSTS